MSLKERFRIDELTSNGSKSITRDGDGGITVRRINKKEIKPTSMPKKFGEEPIRGKQISPKTKEDLASIQVEPFPEQTSFSGETSSRIEKPVYNEEELKKAVDLKVDELIKPQKKSRGKFVTQQKYNQLQSSYNTVNNTLKKTQEELTGVRNQLSAAQSTVETLTSQVNSLESQNSQLIQQSTAQQGQIATLSETISNNNITIAGLQAEAAQFKAESEAKTAQLEAQSRNLQAQLDSQGKVIDSLNVQNRTLQDNITSQANIFTTQLQGLQGQLQSAADVQNALRLQLANQQQESILLQQALREEAADAQAEAARRAADAAAAVARAEQKAQTSKQQAEEAQKKAQESQKKKKKIICNELYNQGFLPHDLWDADERYGDMMFEKDPRLVIGYQMWARYVVDFMRKNPQYTKYTYKFFKPWTEYMAYEMGVIDKQNWKGQFTHFIGKQLSYLVFDLKNGKRLLNLYNYSKFRSDI